MPRAGAPVVPPAFLAFRFISTAWFQLKSAAIERQGASYVHRACSNQGWSCWLRVAPRLVGGGLYFFSWRVKGVTF
jgi:hypothetical protein